MRKFGYAQLLWKTAWHHRATNVAVMLGCFFGASALIGALFVGDSMRASMRTLTIERLGAVEAALVGTRFFGADLAARIDPRVAPSILIQAAVTNPESDATTRVNVIGCDERFWKLFPSERRGIPPSGTCVNRALATRLGLNVGSRLVLKVEKSTSAPREALLGDRSADRALKSIELTVASVLDDRGVGRFGLEASQRLPRNLFVPLADLQKGLEAEGRANALLDPRPATDDAVAAAELKRMLKLDDYELTVRVDPKFGYASVESRRQLLEADAVAPIEKVAKATATPWAPTLAYLANSIEANGKSVPYSVVVACDLAPDGPFAAIAQATVPLNALKKPGDILVNSWTAEQLQLKVGDAIRMTYFGPDATGGLQNEAHSFRLAGIVPMNDAALDPGFVPPFKGITDAANFADWEAPFPIDLKRVRKVDEDYWNAYRTAPKAFVSYADGVGLWSSRFGKATSIRLFPSAGVAANAFANDFQTRLLRELDPAAFGFQFLPIRATALAASQGSTDFGQLFVAFSFLTIVAAALLVGLLFRLNVERRASQIGTELAIGMPIGTVRRLLLAEGLLLAVVGSLAGIGGAMAYARWMIGMLTSRWQSAVGLPFVDYHGSAASAAIGAAAAVAIAWIAIAWAIRALKRATAPRLMRGGVADVENHCSIATRWSVRMTVGSSIAGLTLVGLGATGRAAATSFFGAGAALLIAGLFGLNALVRRRFGELRGRGARAIARLSARNAGRYPARTVLTASMVALAAFLIVALGLLGAAEHDVSGEKNSGTGGFAAIAETSTPIIGDLNSKDGRFQVGIADDAGPLLDGFNIVGFRTRPGDDASCLNVYQPTNPTLLGCSDEFIERGGFSFASTVERNDSEKMNPWKLLNRALDDGAIPAIGDQNSLQWILKVPVGSDLAIASDDGKAIKLRIVGGLANSIFQGQLLISEANFVRVFPNRVGRRYFLFEAKNGSKVETSKLFDSLSRELGAYGVDLETTAGRIASFAAVERTYMTAFQTLGAFGLVLGTFGLAAVLARNVFERRGELGLLAAIGYSRVQLGWLVLAETLITLAVGLAIGSAAALIAVAPAAIHRGSYALGSVAELLAMVLLTGVAAGVAALAFAFRGRTAEALRGN